MRLVIKNFDELTTRELYEILRVRAEVFVVEQNCVYQDLDEIDYRSKHVFYEENGKILAYLRIFHKDINQQLVQMGRILTIKRGIGLGAEIVEEGIQVAKQQMEARQIYIEAQVYAIGFYEIVGFRVTSEEFMEDGIPHVQMLYTCFDKISVNNREFSIVKLLGKGKGGYSYLVTDGISEFVVKQIHHEPCDYYQFGDKMQSEINDYQKLRNIGIRIPELFEVDLKQERILKEYIQGPTVAELVDAGEIKDDYFMQIEEMCRLLYRKNTNIDYYPTNFVVRDGLLYYIDYECNDYMEMWDFENWGKHYWISGIEDIYS